MVCGQRKQPGRYEKRPGQKNDIQKEFLIKLFIISGKPTITIGNLQADSECLYTEK